MLKAFRLLVLLTTPLFFWGAWHVAPELLNADGLKWLSGLVALLWALEFYFFRKLSEVSAVQGITSKEHERLIFKLASLRKRVWWIGGIGFVCSAVIWLLAASKLPMTSPFYASMVGVLVGISVSYLILIPGWLSETQEFIDNARKSDASKKKQVDIAKVLESKSKK